MTENNRIIVWDLDDTLANTYHRSIDFDFDTKDENLWADYFSKCDKDEPIKQTILLLDTMFQNYEGEIHIWTGRNEIVKDKTIEWLIDNKIYYHELKMRPIDCRMKNVDLKYKWAKEVGFENIYCVFDDNENICKMFQDNSVLCYNIKNPIRG